MLSILPRCGLAAAALRLIVCATVTATITATAAAACPQETTDQSQRLLPFPQQQPTTPSVHAELLRRLREALQQSQPEPQPLTQPENKPEAGETPQQPPPATPPEAPQPVAPEELLDLSQSLQNLADRIPPGLIPRGLSEIPPEQLQKSLQHPDTQQSLRKLLEQFRNDGLLPPASENGTPVPGPPRQTPRSEQRDSSETTEPQPTPEPQPDPNSQPAPPVQPRRSPNPSPGLREGTPPLPSPQPGTIPRPNRQPPGEPQPQPQPNSSDSPPPNLSRDTLRRLEDFFNELRQNSPTPTPTPTPPENNSSQPGSSRSPSPGPSPGNPSPNLTPPGTQQPQTPPGSPRRPPIRRRDRAQSGNPIIPQPGKDSSPQSPAPTPNPNPTPDTSRARSLFESLERILQEPPKQPSPEDASPGQPPESANPSQPPFSIPDFLREQLQDPQLQSTERNSRQPRGLQSEKPSDPPQSPAIPETQPEPTPQAEPTPRTRPPVNLDPSQSFGDSFRQLLNEARQEARQQAADQRSANAAPLAQNSPDAPPPPTSRPQPPPPPPPRPGPGRAESLLRMLDDLARTPDRRPNDSGLRQTPRPRSGDSMPLPEPPRSLLENLLGGAQPQASEPSAAANTPTPDGPGDPGDPGDSPNSSTTGLDLSAAPSALSLGATLAVALGVLWLLLKFAGQRRQMAAGSTGNERPLPPDQIRGRPDIVAAYHQLARRTVRSFRPWWHHRQIETLLLQTFPGRQSAITRLAGVYEQSRYAPDSIPLSPTDLETAREAIRECQKSIGGS